MEIKIIGVNVINGEKVFHRMLDPSVVIPDSSDRELLTPKTVYSYQEFTEFEEEEQRLFDILHPDGCLVFLSYIADVKSSNELKKIQADITKRVECM